MKQTLTKRGQKSKADQLEPTSYYCVINPQTAQDLELLDSTRQIVLLDYPIEYEVIEEGEYYIPAWVTDTLLAPRYAIVENLKALPQEPNVEVKEPLHYPENEEEGASYLYNKLVLGLEQLPLDKDTTEYIEENKAGWIPKIKLLVKNNSVNIPLTNMNIKIDNEPCLTNDNGDAEAQKKHYGNANIKCSFYNYNTGNTVKKGAIEIFDIDKFNDVKSVSKNGNRIDIVIDNSKPHIWYKSMVYTSLQKYNNYCDQNGIQKALFLNVWVTSITKGSSAAPLFRILYFSDMNLIKLYILLISSLTIPPLDNLFYILPDIIIGEDNSGFEIEKSVYHELSHYSHAKKRGLSYWSKIIVAETSNMVDTYNMYHKTDSIDPYRNGLYPNIISAKYIGLAESWAHFMEHYIFDYYNSSNTYTFESFYPHQIPFKHYRNSNTWLPIGLYQDLLDNSQDKIQLKDANNQIIRQGFDSFNGVSVNLKINTLYSLITTNGCDSVKALKTLLLNKYSPYTTQINDLFSLYDY